jgi:hypothetical protein
MQTLYLFFNSQEGGGLGVDFFCVSRSFRLECELGWPGRASRDDLSTEAASSQLLSSALFYHQRFNSKGHATNHSKFPCSYMSLLLGLGTVSDGPVPGLSKCERCGRVKRLLSCCQAAEENAITSSGSFVSTVLVLYSLHMVSAIVTV